MTKYAFQLEAGATDDEEVRGESQSPKPTFQSHTVTDVENIQTSSIVPSRSVTPFSVCSPSPGDRRGRAVLLELPSQKFQLQNPCLRLWYMYLEIPNDPQRTLGILRSTPCYVPSICLVVTILAQATPLSIPYSRPHLPLPLPLQILKSFMYLSVN